MHVFAYEMRAVVTSRLSALLGMDTCKDHPTLFSRQRYGFWELQQTKTTMYINIYIYMNNSFDSF